MSNPNQTSLTKTSRFIKMDCHKWQNCFVNRNTKQDLTHGKIYEVYSWDESFDPRFFIKDDVGDTRQLTFLELEGLEVSLSDALIEMSKEDAES